MKIPFTNLEIRSSRQPRPGPWDDFWYGNPSFHSSSGVDVNQDNALTYFAVWACVKIISEDIGSIPLFVYRRSGDSKKKARDLPVYRLLHDQFNPEMTAMQARQTMQAQLLTFGNAYAQIVRNLRGDPIALWPLRADRMKVSRNDRGELQYEFTQDNTEVLIIPGQDVLHIAGLGFNGITGYSPISYHRETIGTGLSEQEFQGSTFRNGAKTSLVLTHPAPKAPSKDGRDNFREEIRKEYAGKGNANKVMVLWEGMKAESLGSMTLEDAQFIESRKMTWLQACAIYRVQPHKVMNLFNATFSNIEHQALEYSTDTIRPWAVCWEQNINMKLLGATSDLYAEHSLDGLMRGDIASRYSAYAVGRQWGWLSVNDIRGFENMNPVPGGDGRLQPLNMIPLGTTPPPAPAPGSSTRDAEITEEEKEQAVLALRRLKLL